MKDWFKYEYGYVNIDENNIYLTNTGNWSEIEGMEERNPKSLVKDNFRRARIKIFFAIIVVLFGGLFFKNLIGNKTVLLILPIGGFYLYKYLRSDMGAKFLIPISKLTNIQFDNNTATLQFINWKSDEDFISLSNVEKKGIELLEKLIKLRNDKEHL